MGQAPALAPCRANGDNRLSFEETVSERPRRHFRRNHGPPPGRQTGPRRRSGEPAGAAARLSGRAGRERPGAARRFRHQRPPRQRAQAQLQRRPHPRHRAGGMRIPFAARHLRAAVPRHGHACAVRPGPAQRAGGARGQRRADADPARSGLHPDPGDLARDPRAQPRARRRARGRPGHHPFAQPARGRRHQIQPAQRRPRGHGHQAGSSGAPTPCSRKEGAK